MWLPSIISFTCYSLAAVGFYWLIPPPHPKEKDSEQYYGYYSNHVSLVHSFVSLILSIVFSLSQDFDLSQLRLVSIKLSIYGWDFCGPNNDLYNLISIVTCPFFAPTAAA